MEHCGLSWGLSGAPPLLEGSEHWGLWPAMFIPIGNTCQAEPLLVVILETFTSGSDASGLAPDKNRMETKEGFWVRAGNLPPTSHFFTLSLGIPIGMMGRALNSLRSPLPTPVFHSNSTIPTLLYSCWGRPQPVP